MMKKHLLFACLFCAAAFVCGSEFLYSIEITPETLADIDIHQSVMIKDVGNGKKAILVSTKYHTWLDLDTEKCIGNEITVTFRYKAVEKGKYPKSATALLRYAEGDI